MELEHLSAEINELRKVIISSSLTTCYLILEMFPSEEEEPTYYEAFRARWIDMYKDIYKLVSKMKIRKSSRRKE